MATEPMPRIAIPFSRTTFSVGTASYTLTPLIHLIQRENDPSASWLLRTELPPDVEAMVCDLEDSQTEPTISSPKQSDSMVIANDDLFAIFGLLPAALPGESPLPAWPLPHTMSPVAPMPAPTPSRPIRVERETPVRPTVLHTQSEPNLRRGKGKSVPGAGPQSPIAQLHQYCREKNIAYNPICRSKQYTGRGKFEHFWCVNLEVEGHFACTSARSRVDAENEAAKIILEKQRLFEVHY
jgi:hypothetical protein